VRHLNDGILRRLVDEPLAIADSQQRHLAACSACGVRYARIEADARDAFASLDLPAFSPNVATAMARVNPRVEAMAPARAGSRLEALRWRRPSFGHSLGSVTAVCAVVAAVTLTPAGSLAQSFVTIFQPKQVTAVQLTSLDIQSLSQLRHYGTIHVPARVSGQRATSVENAAKLSGNKVLVPSSVPSGVPNTVSFAVSPGATASFTFSAAKARTWAATTGKKLPTMPPRVDGSTIDVTVGATVVATYGACSTGCSAIPQLIIGQMVAPRIASTGANLTQLEDYVFSLPGTSQQLATELRSIGDPTSTLPIPIPSSFAHADAVTVQGVHGEAIGDDTGVGSLVVWEKDGVVYAVGGTLPLSQVESIANSLH
jgi:anti-sigma factor RsiW